MSANVSIKQDKLAAKRGWNRMSS